jgi:hypothetical protein
MRHMKNMAKTTQLGMDGLTVDHINNRLGVAPIQKGLTTAHLGQALASSTPQTQGVGPKPATTPVAGNATTSKRG